MRSILLKTILAILIGSLFSAIPIVNAGGHAVLWDSPTTADLRSVYMLDQFEGWAVGADGTILYYDGVDWSIDASPTTNDLVSVFATPHHSNDVWAVGDEGAIVHWDGTMWSNWASPTSQLLYSVCMVSGLDGWAVGSAGTIIRWNGVAWADFASPCSSDVYLFDVYMVDSDIGWAVGIDVLPYPMIEIIYWDGTEWNLYEPTVQFNLISVYMVSGTDGWAVGTGGKIFHYNGFDWASVTSPTDTTLRSVCMVNEVVGWAVGDDGTIIRRSSGSWSNAPSPTSNDLYSVSMVGAYLGWAVGDSGTIIKWDGSHWIPEFPVFLLVPFLAALTLMSVFYKNKVESHHIEVNAS